MLAHVFFYNTALACTECCSLIPFTDQGLVHLVHVSHSGAHLLHLLLRGEKSKGGRR